MNREEVRDFLPVPVGTGRGAPVCAPGGGRTAGRHAGRPLPGEINAALFRICHCEERQRRGNPHPLMCDVESRKKRTDPHVGAVPLLGMTGSEGDASFFTRHKIPRRAGLEPAPTSSLFTIHAYFLSRSLRDKTNSRHPQMPGICTILYMYATTSCGHSAKALRRYSAGTVSLTL